MPISRSGRDRNELILAVTLGDPAGIGPEVALKAIHTLRKEITGRVLLLGGASFFSRLAVRLKLPLDFNDVQTSEIRSSSGKTIPCCFDRDIPTSLGFGRSDVRATKLAVRSIQKAVFLTMKGVVDGMVTPPIHKAGLKKAGFHMPGHTEYLAELSGTRHCEMMLVGGPLRVVPVTRHVPLKSVSSLLTKKKIMDAIRLTARELRVSFGLKNPRLVVCGLNPHAGEEGILGREEIDLIAPAVRSIRKTNIRARIFGPLSPDVLFHDAYEGRYDGVICMYHDQGLIPLKMISRGHGVNVTLGLPFVRTSPDHGTAYDIAGSFKADPGSMIEAIRLAFKLARNKKAR